MSCLFYELIAGIIGRDGFASGALHGEKSNKGGDWRSPNYAGSRPSLTATALGYHAFGLAVSQHARSNHWAI